MTLVASFVGVWIKISLESDKNKNHFVASLVDAWIKIEYIIFSSDCFKVASLADAWIKIEWENLQSGKRESSHPSRMRGLKWLIYMNF